MKTLVYAVSLKHNPTEAVIPTVRDSFSVNAFVLLGPRNSRLIKSWKVELSSHETAYVSFF